MTLGAPLGLLALLGLPVLGALYFLRRRQPPRTVSALFLWRGADRRADAGPRLERFNREASLALECGAVLAAALFLADPQCGRSQVRTQSVIVLDSSLSMGAHRSDGRTVAEAALAWVRERVRLDGGRVTLILSGTHPRVALGPAAAPRELDAFEFKPLGPSHNLESSLALARELAGVEARVSLVTDKPLDGPLAPEVEVIALGEPRENTAFVAAQRRDQDGTAHLVLRVARFGNAIQAPLTLRDSEGKLVHRQVLNLVEGGETEVRLDLATPGSMVAELPDDALEADNQVTLLPNPIRAVRVDLNLPEGTARHAFQEALEADGRVAFGVPADLTIAPEDGQASPPWTVKVGARGKLDAFAGPFFADKQSRLLDGVDLSQVVWSAGDSPLGEPLLTIGDRVLATEEAGPSYHLNVDLGRSGLGRATAWPILIANLLDVRRLSLEGVRPRHQPLGGALALTLTPGHRWALEGPTGHRDLLAVGAVTVPAPELPGTYRLVRDGSPLEAFQVEAVAPAESDLRDRASGVRESTARLGGAAPDASGRPGWALALLAALLAADWWITGPRRGWAWGAA